MRFIAAGLVFFFHASYEGLFADPTAQDVFSKLVGQGGWAGVGFFFVLSGFVLTWSARPTDTPPKFWRRRIFKIYPNHIVTYIAAVFFLLWLGQAIDLGPAIANLFLLQSWFPQLEIEVSVNPVAWSLSCEALFYLCFPFLLMAINKIPRERIWAWIAGIMAVILAMPVVATALLPDGPVPPWAQASEWEFWGIYVLPPVRMLDFVIGMLLARLIILGGRFPFRLWHTGVIALAAYVGAWFIPWTYSLTAIWILPAGLVIAAGAMADVRGTRSPLRHPAMVWLGEISFAFYLWHRLVLTGGHNLLGGVGTAYDTPTAIAVLVLLFGVNLVLSWWLYALVERPIMRRWSRSRRDRAAGRDPNAGPAPVTLPAPRSPVPDDGLAGIPAVGDPVPVAATGEPPGKG